MTNKNKSILGSNLEDFMDALENDESLIEKLDKKIQDVCSFVENDSWTFYCCTPRDVKYAFEDEIFYDIDTISNELKLEKTLKDYVTSCDVIVSSLEEVSFRMDTLKLEHQELLEKLKTLKDTNKKQRK